MTTVFYDPALVPRKSNYTAWPPFVTLGPGRAILLSHTLMLACGDSWQYAALIYDSDRPSELRIKLLREDDSERRRVPLTRFKATSGTKGCRLTARGYQDLLGLEKLKQLKKGTRFAADWDPSMRIIRVDMRKPMTREGAAK